MAHSLYSTVLKHYTYDELKELCFAPGSTLANIFDTKWDIWRDKAVADFGISPQFFDLVKVLSGPQRYLQISTYVKITPLSLAVEYDQTIEGVYDVWTAFVEARERKDKEVMLWLADCMTPEQEELVGLSHEIKRTLDVWATEEEEFCHTPFHDLCLVIKQGKVDILDQIIHKYFTLPEGFSIERDIPKVPFWEFDKHKTIYDLPLQTTGRAILGKIIYACLESDDARIVDFFRSIFRDRDLQEIVASSAFSRKSLLVHGKPEEAYSIALRFIDENTSSHHLSYMSELVLLFPKQTAHDYSYLVTRRLGNVTFIASILPYLTTEDVKEILDFYEENERILYPVSISLLEERL